MQNYQIPSPSGGTMTVQVDDEEAERLGLKKAPAPKNKQAAPTNNKK